MQPLNHELSGGARGTTRPATQPQSFNHFMVCNTACMNNDDALRLRAGKLNELLQSILPMPTVNNTIVEHDRDGLCRYVNVLGAAIASELGEVAARRVIAGYENLDVALNKTITFSRFDTGINRLRRIDQMLCEHRLNADVSVDPEMLTKLLVPKFQVDGTDWINYFTIRKYSGTADTLRDGILPRLTSTKDFREISSQLRRLSSDLDFVVHPPWEIGQFLRNVVAAVEGDPSTKIQKKMARTVIQKPGTLSISEKSFFEHLGISDPIQRNLHLDAEGREWGTRFKGFFVDAGVQRSRWLKAEFPTRPVESAFFEKWRKDRQMSPGDISSSLLMAAQNDREALVTFANIDENGTLVGISGVCGVILYPPATAFCKVIDFVRERSKTIELSCIVRVDTPK